MYIWFLSHKHEGDIIVCLIQANTKKKASDLANAYLRTEYNDWEFEYVRPKGTKFLSVYPEDVIS